MTFTNSSGSTTTSNSIFIPAICAISALAGLELILLLLVCLCCAYRRAGGHQRSGAKDPEEIDLDQQGAGNQEISTSQVSNSLPYQASQLYDSIRDYNRGFEVNTSSSRTADISTGPNPSYHHNISMVKNQAYEQDNA